MDKPATTDGQDLPDYTLPRILCLHGGGTNADVFRAQCRVFLHVLEDTFRFVFVDGPAFCRAHDDIVPVYGDWGPFRRWLRWLPEHEREGVDDETEWEECKYAVQSAMEADDRKVAAALGSATEGGKWVGMMGFSQGSKIAASLLYERQLELEQGLKGLGDWEWAVLMAGRGPIVGLEAIRDGTVKSMRNGDTHPPKLRLPTLHVHGLLDPGLLFHQALLEKYCEPGTTTLIEWEGEHRVPIKTPDVTRVVDAMLRISNIKNKHAGGINGARQLRG